MAGAARGGQTAPATGGNFFSSLGPQQLFPAKPAAGGGKGGGAQAVPAPAPSSGQTLASMMNGGRGPDPTPQMQTPPSSLPVATPDFSALANSGSPTRGGTETMNPAGAGSTVLANAVGSSGMLGEPAPAGSGKGGGGAVGQPMPRPTQGQFAPLAPQGGFNVNQASAGALQQAMQGTQGAMEGPLAVSQFMNPYTQNVINRTQMDIMRQQQMAQNQLGAQATAARAFGGSRQGVAEGVLAGEYGRMAGDIAAQQRQAGYTQALDAAMRDRAARLGAASQLGALGQQAFQTGQTIQQQQAQQGLLQQGLQQALIDAARQQYAGYVGSPAAALQAPLAALGVVPAPESTTKSKQPGFYDYASMAATAYAMCWVAREVYGEDNPKWLQFRDWVVGVSPDWFFNLYSKHGEKVAEKVKRNPWTKKVLRPLMDIARKSLGYK